MALPYGMASQLRSGSLYFYRSGAYISYDLTVAAAQPAPAAVFLAFGDALLKAGAYVWFQVIPLTVASITAPTSVTTWIVILVAFLAVAFYLARLRLDWR